MRINCQRWRMNRRPKTACLPGSRMRNSLAGDIAAMADAGSRGGLPARCSVLDPANGRRVNALLARRLAGKPIAPVCDMQTAEAPRFRVPTVLPVQFHAARAIEPERRLMLAVLDDAIGIYRKYAPVRGRKRRVLVRETEEWLFSNDASWPFSFVNLCQALDLDVAWLRAQLRRPTSAAVAQSVFQ